jgi:hypothetical protein
LAEILAAAARGSAPALIPELPYDVGVRLVGRWSTDRLYCSRGKAKRLPLRGAVSFTSLARAARAGTPERARDALVAAGLVKAHRDGTLQLLHTVYVPQSGRNTKMDIAGQAAAEFVRVLMHNTNAPPEQTFLQRVACYDNIGSSSLTPLRTALRREGVRALERANGLLAARDRDRHPAASRGRRTRVSFGVYVFEEPVEAASRRKK